MSDGMESGSGVESITALVSEIVNALAPFVSAAIPGTTEAISLGQKIIQGVIALEPQAIELYQRIVDGVSVTEEQLAQFASDYEAAYQQLNSDINAKLAEGGS